MGLRSRLPVMSAWNCMMMSLTLAPPSTLISGIGRPVSAAMASMTSFDW